MNVLYILYYILTELLLMTSKEHSSDTALDF